MNDNISNYDKDVLYHLNQIALNCENLQLYYNRDRMIIHYVENTNKTLQVIEKLYKFSNNPKLIELGRNINELFDADKELSKVTISLFNSKRIVNADAIGFINFSI